MERHLFGSDLSLTRSGIHSASQTLTSFNRSVDAFDRWEMVLDASVIMQKFCYFIFCPPCVAHSVTQAESEEEEPAAAVAAPVFSAPSVTSSEQTGTDSHCEEALMHSIGVSRALSTHTCLPFHPPPQLLSV